MTRVKCLLRSILLRMRGQFLLVGACMVAARGLAADVPAAATDQVLEHHGNAARSGLYVLPGLDLVVAITAGNYDTPDQWVPPTRVMREVVLPSIV